MTTAHPLAGLPAGQPALFEPLELTLDIQQRDWNLCLVNGYLDCVPIGSIGGRYLIALRAVRGRLLQECPVVLLHPMTAESRIICDSPAGAIPALLLELLFGCPPVLWDVFSLASDDVWSELHEVHRALLGDVRHLDALREVLADSDDRNAMVHGDAHRSNEQLNRYRDIQGRVMAGLPRADFAAFMTRVISLEPREDPEPDALRAWSNAAWTIHCYNRLGNAITGEQWRAALLQAIRRPAGQEGPYDGPVETPVFHGGDGRGKGPTWRVAKWLRKKLPSLGETDPLVRSAFAMLEQGPRDYDGLAHAEAAADLNTAGDADAISAMLSAAFFNRVRYGTTQTAMIGAYRAMVHEADVQPYGYVIDALMGSAG